MQEAPYCLVVAVQTRMELDAALNESVDLLKPAAITQQIGISVTRLALGRYGVCLNNEVPPGVTIEEWGVSCDEPR